MPEINQFPYSVRLNQGSQHADVYIYGVIGWDATPEGLVRQLNENSNLNSITVHINSIGGYIGDGLAILNTLRQHKAQVTTINEGYALSMGSVVMQAGDERLMADNALMMIHRAQGGAYGDAKDMEKEAEILKKHEQALIREYSRVMDLSSDEIQALLDEETWFTADEARQSGLVSDIIDPVNLDDAENTIPDTHWRAAASAGFKHAPDHLNRRMSIFLPSNGGQNMPPKPDKGTAGKETDEPKDKETPKPLDARAVAKEAVAAENRRQASIREAFDNVVGYLGERKEALLKQCLDDVDCDLSKTNKLIVDEIGKNNPPPVGNHAIVIEDERDRFRQGVSIALMNRSGMAQSDDRGNEFRGYTLLELARASLRMNGISTGGMSKLDLVGNAFTHSSGDFSSLLANVAEKSMLKGYDEAEETFQLWTATGSASDFKPVSRVDLNSFPALSVVAEGAEYTHGTIGDRGETVQLATYGKLFSITRQAVINDDISAFTRIPQRMGRAAIRTVGDLVYAVLTGNPTMSDGVALFHSTHKNLLSASVINTSSVDEMRVAMGTQKDAGDKAHALNIRLATLLVPMAVEGVARVTADSEFEVGGNGDKTIPNSVRGTFDVISDARLDAASNKTWYGAASASAHDTIEVTYLDGQEQPYLESRNGWNIDGAEFKVRIDAAVNPLDFRTLAKNPGA